MLYNLETRPSTVHLFPSGCAAHDHLFSRLPRALCQHIRPPSQSTSGGSPLQPGCFERCVNTEDLRLRAVAHLFSPAASSVASTQKTSVSERWLTSSARLPRALRQHIRPPSPSGGSPLQPGCFERCVNTEDLRLRAVAHLFSSARLPRALRQHIRPPSPSGGSPLQPGCLERCVNTLDLRLRAVAHLFNPALSNVPHFALSLSPRPEDLLISWLWLPPPPPPRPWTLSTTCAPARRVGQL